MHTQRQMAILLILLMPVLLWAEAGFGMSSANYAIPRAVLDGGGATKSSTSYSLSHSIGQGAGVGTFASANYINLAGFWRPGGTVEPRTPLTPFADPETGRQVVYDPEHDNYWYQDLAELTGKTYDEQVAAVAELNDGAYFDSESWHLATLEEMEQIWPADAADRAQIETITEAFQPSDPSLPVYRGRFAEAWPEAGVPSHGEVSLTDVPDNSSFDPLPGIAVADAAVEADLGAWIVAESAALTPPSTALSVSEESGESVVYDESHETYWLRDLGSFANRSYAQQTASIADLNTQSYFGRNDWHLASLREMRQIWPADAGDTAQAERLTQLFQPSDSTGELANAYVGRYNMTVPGAALPSHGLVAITSVPDNSSFDPLLGRVVADIATVMTFSPETPISAWVVAEKYEAADVNQDGYVNVQDLQLLINCILYGACDNCDVNRDGYSNVQDLQLIINDILGL